MSLALGIMWLILSVTDTPCTIDVAGVDPTHHLPGAAATSDPPMVGPTWTILLHLTTIWVLLQAFLAPWAVLQACLVPGAFRHIAFAA